jgi:hypothetical protein
VVPPAPKVSAGTLSSWFVQHFPVSYNMVLHGNRHCSFPSCFQVSRMHPLLRERS